MVIKERYGLQLKNGSFALDEETNTPRLFTTKRAAFLHFGKDANIQTIVCTYEVAPKEKKPLWKKGK